MWITRGLRGHSSHSITTVHCGRRDSRQEGWTGKERRSKVVQEGIKRTGVTSSGLHPYVSESDEMRLIKSLV